MGYQMQLIELHYKIERMNKTHLDEMERIKWKNCAGLLGFEAI